MVEEKEKLYEITVEQKRMKSYDNGDAYEITDELEGRFEGLTGEAVIFIETMLRCFKGATVTIRLKEENKEA